MSNIDPQLLSLSLTAVQESSTSCKVSQQFNHTVLNESALGNQSECKDKNQHKEEKDNDKGDNDDSDESDESDGSNDDSTNDDTSQPIRVYSRPATNTATFTTKSGSMPDMRDNLALQFNEFYFIFILLFYHFFF